MSKAIIVIILLAVTITSSCNQSKKGDDETSSTNTKSEGVEKVSTRLGDLAMESGYPSEEAIEKLTSKGQVEEIVKEVLEEYFKKKLA